MALQETEESQLDLELFQLKKTLEFLDEGKGHGTSLITLLVPSGGQLSRINKLLCDETSAASSIKSRV